MTLYKSNSNNLKRNEFYFFLTLLVIVISGNPAVGIIGKEVFYVGTFLIFVGVWWARPIKLRPQEGFVLFLFVLLMLAHVLNFGSLAVAASLGFLITVCIALLSVKLIPDFSKRYVSVMYFLSLTSFIFWVPLSIGVDLQSIFAAVRLPIPLGDAHYHIGIYNLRDEVDGSIRNMSMFWEPGAFAGYLMLALFFLARDVKNNAVLNKRGLVLILALLSTQSTTGYIAFMVLSLLFVYRVFADKGAAVKLLVLPATFIVLGGISYVTINEVPFLGEKISRQFESASVLDDHSRINRFGNFLYDTGWIADRPIVGWSANPETRYAIDPEVADIIVGQGNGLTGFAVKFGLVGLASFIVLFGFSTLRITGSPSTALFGVVIVCVLLNGEQFLGFPVFLSLMFMPGSKYRRPVQSCSPNFERAGFGLKWMGAKL